MLRPPPSARVAYAAADAVANLPSFCVLILYHYTTVLRAQQGGDVVYQPQEDFRVIQNKTSGYATWFTAGGAIRIVHYNVIDDVITRKVQEIEKNGDHLAP